MRYNSQHFLTCTYYEENFSTKQSKKKKNPWFSRKNVNQGRKGYII